MRDLDLAAAPRGNPLVGDSGRIDPALHRIVLADRGPRQHRRTVSTAVGAALAHRTGPAFARVGDVAFLYDAAGLVR